MKNKFILIFALVIVELIVIFLLGSEIYSKQNGTAMIVHPIDKEDILFPGDGELKNFYENKPKKIVEDQWGRKIENTINSDSLNERFEYTTDKPNGTFRIVSLGDSWTFGFGVDTKDNYSEVLEDLLNDDLHCENFEKFEVINLGIPGYDIEYSVERFRRRGQKYDPDLVIWLIKNGNFFPTEILWPRLRDLRKNSGPVSLDIPLLTYKEALREIGMEKMIQYERKALGLMDNYYKNALLFFLLGVTENQKASIEDFAKSRDNIHIYKKGSDLPSDEILPNNNHPNIEGHQTLANEFFQYIIKKNIIPCN